MNSQDFILAVALAIALVVFLLVDLRLFARHREPTIREATAWSIGWLLVGLSVSLVLVPTAGSDDAVVYTTVYLIERSLSLDNLFVFLLLFAYFAVPVEQRARLIFWGIVMAIALRGLAILAGIALLERFEFLVYVLGIALLVLAARFFFGSDEALEPGKVPTVRLVRRFVSVTDGYHGHRWFVRIAGKRHATPLFLALAAIVFADLTFAIDSIPAAFGITREPLLIWLGNAFALLGLRALFVLVDGLVRRFRYLDESIALALAVVATKLLIEDFYKAPAGLSLGIVLALLVGGILLSQAAERRERRRGKAPQRQ